ncbi:MAG TPA: zf-HC2 domain-containing protein [Thermoanaerobaculia bacterium]|nr:zf-HC2 domain-containing protein [Thermoanaerobaculia bacterium]
MSRDPREETFAGHLRGAFGKDCPAPEVFLEAEWVALSAAERSRIEAHAATCPACAAERDLAGQWDLPVDSGDVSAEDLAYVVGRIEESQAEAAPPARSNVVPFPVGRKTQSAESIAVPESRTARRPGRSFASWGLALAAMLAVGIGLAIGLRFQSDLPDLPPPPTGAETYRGSAVLLEGPEGELAKPPAVLGWEDVPGAASYRVRIVDPLGEEIWSATAKTSPLPVPAATVAKLQTAVVYAWSVEAFDAGGKRLAGAEPLKFRIAPAP